MDADLRQYLDGKFGRFDEKIDAKFAAIDVKFAAIDGKFAAIDKKFAAIDEKFVEMEDRLVEKMRDMQTELLRGFAAFTEAQTIRLR
jgi:hypothetical protein